MVFGFSDCKTGLAFKMANEELQSAISLKNTDRFRAIAILGAIGLY